MASPRDKSGTTAFNPIDVHVGKRVRICRKLQNLTQTQLADKAGVTFQQLQKYERAANRISASRLFAISEALDVPVSYFFEDMPEELAGPRREMPGIPDFDTTEAASIAKAYRGIEDKDVRRTLFKLAKAMTRDDE